MARKTFISYKYSESCDVRDRIIRALGDDATYYKGEDGYSQDLSGYAAETIKEHLKKMIYDTSVTIVVLSPEMNDSAWIPWELEYSLKDVKRGDRCSHSNGIVAVVKKVDGSYSWLRRDVVQADGCHTHSFDESKLPKIISDNRSNQEPKEYACNCCKSIDWLSGSYISVINEDDFIDDPSRFIENAYEKSQRLENYRLTKRAS